MVPAARQTHFASVAKTKNLVAVCSKIYTHHTNTLCKQNVAPLVIILVLYKEMAGLYKVKHIMDCIKLYINFTNKECLKKRGSFYTKRM